MKKFMPVLPTEEEIKRGLLRAYLNARRNKTCISYWYPKIKAALPEIMMPKTEFVYVNPFELYPLLDYITTDYIKDAVRRIGEAADKIGYPCFMKTGLFSGKHQWKDTCYIQSKDQIAKHLGSLIEWQCLVGCEVSLYIVVREMIPTVPAFHAFEGMPITKERRYFSKDGHTHFNHPYWPPYSMQEPDAEDWEAKLSELNTQTDREIKTLTEKSNQISALLTGDWSIDWLYDKYGNWWLTDMAEANKSFKWADYKTTSI